MAKKNIIRKHAENLFAKELAALRKADKDFKPENWNLSPKSVVLYIMGGTMKDGMVISPKYFGQQKLIEQAVATLATDRALLLTGSPGTAKTWVSEHLAAAISGDSTLLVQGTSGIGEDALRYGWNYAQLLSKGPSKDALVPSPVMKAMQEGKIVRVEELTRIPADVQDALITILSEKTLPIPELNNEIQALKGFNLIATANDRDKGINELSSALQRRFNTIALPLPATLEEEVQIVRHRLESMQKALPGHEGIIAEEEIVRLITIFRELRNGKTEDGRNKTKVPSGTLSTAEAISVANNSLAMAQYFGSGKVTAAELVSSMTGTIIKDNEKDSLVWKEYLETIIRYRKGWEDIYKFGVK